MTRAIHGFLLLVFLASPAGAGGRYSTFPPQAAATLSQPQASAAASRRLEAFVTQRRFEARVRMSQSARDAERRVAEAQLRRSGSRAQLTRYRLRVAREDDLDSLRLRSELRRITLAAEGADAERWWSGLGPRTRAALLRSGLDLQRTTRDAELSTRIDALERAPGPPQLP